MTRFRGTPHPAFTEAVERLAPKGYQYARQFPKGNKEKCLKVAAKQFGTDDLQAVTGYIELRFHKKRGGGPHVIHCPVGWIVYYKPKAEPVQSGPSISKEEVTWNYHARCPCGVCPVVAQTGKCWRCTFPTERT